jgi:hypothetical protein
MPFDLVQSGVAAILGDGAEAIDALDALDAPAVIEGVDSEAVNADPGATEKLFDLRNRGRFPLNILFSELFRLTARPP